MFFNAIDFKSDNVTLYNSEPIIHKLSHQHIHTHFWLINTSKKQVETINISNIKNYPVPILIDNFIKDFKL